MLSGEKQNFFPKANVVVIHYELEYDGGIFKENSVSGCVK